jgi:Holliday junction resolvase
MSASTQLSEAAIQRMVMKALEAAGWTCVKLIQTNLNGMPDLLCLRGGMTMFIEVKSQTGKASPMQLHRIHQLKMNGFGAYVVSSVKQLYMMGLISEL